LEQLQLGELCLVDPVGDHLKGLALKHADIKKVIFAFKEMKKLAYQEGVRAAQKAMRDAFGLRSSDLISSSNRHGDV
jgi:hypothetical protein